MIAVFTGNRAEYGLQYPILRAIAAHPQLEYRLIVSGAHLDPNFGRTLAEIEADGFAVYAEAKIEMGEDTLHGTAHAIASCVASVSRILSVLRPDALVVYADRFEGFGAVIAGTQTNVPTAHVEGGDLTEGGALDDSVRHAMTKLAHLHFTTNDGATNRILAMGEEPWRVHTVGFPAIDLIRDGLYASADEIVSRYGIDPRRPVVLFTQHSVTTEFETAAQQVRPSLRALDRLAAEDIQIIITYPNNDAGGRAIIAELEQFGARGHQNIQVHRSMGRYNYHGVLALARLSHGRVVCVGNSSSGIKETVAFGCPAVNIGSRQNGRLRGENVLDVPYDDSAIYDAVKQCLFDEAWRRRCANASNPYGMGDAGRKIANVLAECPLDRRLLQKRMTLRGEQSDGWFR